MKKFALVLATMIIATGCGASTNNDVQSGLETSVTNNGSNENSNKIKQGTYKIGDDLEAGEYLFIANGMGYVEVAKDGTGNLEGIIHNDNVTGHTYVTVEDGQYLKLQFGEAYPVGSAPSIIPENGLYKDGEYKVGKDIPAGEYELISNTEMGYFEVSKDSNGTLDSIITNDFVTSNAYVTVEDGEYLKLQGVEIQK